MGFGDKLRKKRLDAGIKQGELAKIVGVSLRTLQNYESEMRRPSNMVTVQKLADVLGTTTSYLLGTDDSLVIEARERGGVQAERDIDELVSEVSGLFAGGTLSDEALDGAMRALNDAYWIAKENNRKYAPHKRATKPKENG